MANPFPFVAGNTLLASQLNGIGEWTDYTPTWTATTTNPTVGNGSVVGRYARVQNLVMVQFKITFASTTNKGSGQYKISLPVTADTVLGTYGVLGSGYIIDASIGNAYTSVVLVDITSTTTVRFKITGTGNFGDVSDTSPMTFADGDEIHGTFFYKAA